MKILIFFLASAAQAYTSLTVPAGSSVTLNIPEVPAFAMKDFRIEGRIHNLAPIASGSINILQTPQIRIFILFSTGTCTISGTCTCGLGADASADDGSGVDAVIIPTQCFCSQSTTPGDGRELAICVNVTGSPDFQFRAQRFASGSTVQSAWPGGQTLEVMDLATGVMLAPTAGGWIGRWAGGLRPTGTTANNGSSSPRQFLGGSGSPAF
jgi:hypothetical protein